MPNTCSFKTETQSPYLYIGSTLIDTISVVLILCVGVVAVIRFVLFAIFEKEKVRIVFLPLHEIVQVLIYIPF